MRELKYIAWLLLGLAASVGFTYLLIVSDFDWDWAVFNNEHELLVWMASPIVLIGMFVPIVIIARFYRKSRRTGKKEARLQYFRALYSFLFTYGLMTLLKVFTNRVDMEPFEPIGTINTSDQFRFGFMNSNSWWESFSEGWPSGHTLIAVGMAIAIHPLLKSKFWRSVNIVYPIAMGLSVSTAYHWVSDVVAGGILGIIVGVYFARYQKKSMEVSAQVQ